MFDLIRFIKYFVALRLKLVTGNYAPTYPVSLQFRWKLWKRTHGRLHS